jgi:hypothetical protein
MRRAHSQRKIQAPNLREHDRRGKCRRAPALEHAVNTLTAAPLRTKRTSIRRFAQAASRGPFARTTDRSRDSFISETMDPASRRAGRSALSSVRHFAPAARMKQQERRQADPGAAHNAGCLENLYGERLAEPMHTAMSELDRAVHVTSRNAERRHSRAQRDANAVTCAPSPPNRAKCASSNRPDSELSAKTGWAVLHRRDPKRAIPMVVRKPRSEASR